MKNNVLEYENYHVTRDGEVYNIQRNILMTPLVHQGYSQVNLRKPGLRRTKFVHRLLAQAYIPNPLKKKEVNHIDGNKLNNNLDNLEWATPKENIQHAYANGLARNPKGKDSPSFGTRNGGRSKVTIATDANGMEKSFLSGAEAVRQKYATTTAALISAIRAKRVHNGYLWRYQE